MLLLLNNVYKKGGLVVWIYPCLFCSLSLSLSLLMLLLQVSRIFLLNNKMITFLFLITVNL